ncbi:hypothetical protein CC86DRAFT_358166 [Ophiobolus disseminans]|uniref:Uncharacterized protein n=1 Tax=Ophiobolus disseminans TaxID=1469910 RepID=A0A6A6ZMI3_9PLEO|nr:hypothetical protein CC86DRAFT_358166 [Ophiobolus disseminans]
MMDLSATLAPEEIAILSDRYRTLLDAGNQFTAHTLDAKTSTETVFEVGLRLKNTLDALEGGIMIEPNDRALALFINCEYLLWRLYEDGPQKDNPFLSHWVEAAQRLHKRDSRGEQKEGTSESLTIQKIAAVRGLWVTTLLEQEKLLNWLDYTPEKVYETLVKGDFDRSFDVQPFIRILEDEGIYEKAPKAQETAHEKRSASQSIPPSANGNNDNIPTIPHTTSLSSEKSLQDEKDIILHKLSSYRDQDAAIAQIMHLPLAIPYLDFFTTLVADHVFEKCGIEPLPVITRYIQSALRTIEHATEPPVTPHAAIAGAQYGKDAQMRYTQLLVLFIKSLIRKGLVQVGDLEFEIAEITVRLVWIPEVREFKAWLWSGGGSVE